MDAKKAIKYLRQCHNGIYCFRNNGKPALEIAALIESLAADAELGRAAVEAVNQFVCGISVGDGKLPECNNCHWQNFCRLRTGKEVK